MNKLIPKRVLLFLILVLLLAGCASKQAFLNGEKFMLEKKYDEAVAMYFSALTEDPENQEYRMKLDTARYKAAWEHLLKGRSLNKEGSFSEAAVEFQQAAALDPTLEVAQQELQEAKKLLQIEKLISEAEKLYKSRHFSQAKDKLMQASKLSPDNRKVLQLLEQVKKEHRTIIDGFELDVASDKPITLKFKKTNIQDVFDILSKLSGINFIFDEDIRPQKVSVFLEKATFAQALELLLKMNNLEKKVLNSKTIIIYPKTKEKENQFGDKIIQTFYLSNIDAKKAVNLLRTMLQLRKIYVHEELNALILRDSPEVIQLARQVIEAADRADSEVVFDLELVEVSHGDDVKLGPELKNYSTTIGLAEPGGTTIADNITVSGLSRLQTLYTLPSVTFDLKKELTDSEILANPKIRVKNKDKAKVHVGTREPITTTTTTNETVSVNVQYVDVGVKLDIEPTIQLDGTVVTKLSLEVSSVSESKEIGETTVLTITTTNAQTTLTLKDGERTIIGGLIRDDLTKTKKSIPFLGDLPLIGHLISGHENKKQKREILLSITPHIVKVVDLPQADVATIWSGGEDDLKAGPSFGSFATSFEPELEKPLPPSAPAAKPAVHPAVEAELQEKKDEPLPTPALPDDKQQPPSADEVTEKGIAPPLGMAPTPPVSPAAIKTEPAAESRIFLDGPDQIKSGTEFGIEVAIENIKDLFSAPLFVIYPPQKLTFVRAIEGNFLKQGGQSTIFTTSGNQKKGQLIVGLKQAKGGSGASGEGTLFRLIFKAQTPGEATVNLDRINFRNPAGDRLSVPAAEIKIRVL